MSSAEPTTALAETDLAEINTATKQSFQQQLRVTTDVGWIWSMNQFLKTIQSFIWFYFFQLLVLKLNVIKFDCFIIIYYPPNICHIDLSLSGSFSSLCLAESLV